MNRNLKTTLMTTVCAGAFLLLAVAVSGAFYPQMAMGATAPPEGLAAAKQLSDVFSAIADKASPAVVSIQVEKEMRGQALPFLRGGPGGMGGGDPFEFFFGPGFRGNRAPEGDDSEGAPVPFGEGTGFIISPDGYIMTNHHVAGEADRMTVKLADGREFEAKRIGSDPQTEIALIKIDAEGLPTLPLGDSDKLKVGEWVLAIGSPFGLSQTVTSGIISARGRSNVGIVDYGDFIQTDAAINPGNSGGPLLNLDAEVIGMNTAIFSKTGGSLGIGFAIPVNMIKYVEKELRENGSVKRGYLGVAIQNLTPDLAEWFDAVEGKGGVLVGEVSPDSPAAKAGLKMNDVITAFDGQPVDDAGSFRSHVSTTAPGARVKMTVVRDGKELEQEIEVGQKPSDGTMVVSKQGGNIELGLNVQNVTDEVAQRLGFADLSGVVVTQVKPGSAAADAGLKPGVLIQEVNRNPIHNTQEFEAALKSDSEHKGVLFLVRDGEYSHYVALKFDK